MFRLKKRQFLKIASILLLSACSTKRASLVNTQERAIGDKLQEDSAIEDNRRKDAVILANSLCALVSEGIERDHIAKALTYVKNQVKSIEEFMILLPNDTVLQSINPDDIGKKRTEIERLKNQDLGKVLVFVNPIFNRDVCRSCHDPGRRVLGILLQMHTRLLNTE